MSRVVTVHVVGTRPRSRWAFRRVGGVFGLIAVLGVGGWWAAQSGFPALADTTVGAGPGTGGWRPPAGTATRADDLAAGQENGMTLVPCRAMIKNDVHLGRIRSDFKGCHIGFDGHEADIAPYETLGLSWRSSGPAQFPAGEANVPQPEAGLETVPLYSCRTAYNGGVHLGEVKAGERGCSFGFGGKRIQTAGGEVLQAAPWLAWSPALARSLPDTAVAGGSEDGEAFFVCRAADHDGLHPGKVKRSSAGCSIVSDGKEASVDRFEVLVAHWVGARGGTVPVAAVLAGREGGRPQYLCRAQTRDGLEIGKVNEMLGGCHIGMLGREVVAPEYDVLSQ